MALSRKQRIGFFPGVWDLFHVGHLRAIREACTLCDRLIIGVNMNPTRGNSKKNEPIIPWEERVEIVKNIKGVKEVFPYRDDELLFQLDRGKAFWDIRFMGQEYKGKKHQPIKAKVVYVVGDQRYHTSKLRKQIYETEDIINRKQGVHRKKYGEATTSRRRRASRS